MLVVTQHFPSNLPRSFRRTRKNRTRFAIIENPNFAEVVAHGGQCRLEFVFCTRRRCLMALSHPILGRIRQSNVLL